MRKISMRRLLVTALLMSCAFAYADTVSPYVVFGNGVRLDSNELADSMDSPKGLGFMFDGDPNTSWKYQKRDERYRKGTQASLRIRSPRSAITSMTFLTTCGDLLQIDLVETGKKFGGAKSDASGKVILDVGGKGDFLLKFGSEDVCISEMKIYAGNNELTKDPSFIVSGGSSYPDVFFYSKHKWVDSFSAGNTTDFYFLENGNYACFILWMEIGPLGGIRIYNTKTLSKLDILEGQYLNVESIKWNGRTVSGMLVKPNENWVEKKFSINAKFP